MNEKIKKLMQDAYIQGYRKRAMMSGQKYDWVSELSAISEFENWFNNLFPEYVKNN